MKFSITIPAYKRKFLSEAIESCLAQSYKDFELIIVDDASPEDLESVVNSFKDSRIRYYRNEKNCGAVDVVDNWNKCLDYAQGDYIICMGDDDRLLPCCLEEYAKLIDKYPNLGVYHAWTELIDEDSKFLTLQQPRPEYETCLSLLWNRWHGRIQFIGDFCYDMRRLREDGGFYKIAMAWGSDDVSAVRAARYGGIANTQKLCFQYRQNRYTITSTGDVFVKLDAIIKEKMWYGNFLAAYENLIKEDIDMKYFSCVMSEMDQYYKTKLKNEMARDFACHPMHVFKVLNWRKKYNVSAVRVLMALEKGIESRFHGM